MTQSKSDCLDFSEFSLVLTLRSLNLDFILGLVCVCVSSSLSLCLSQ